MIDRSYCCLLLKLKIINLIKINIYDWWFTLLPNTIEIFTVLKGFAHLLRKFEPIQIHYFFSSYGCFGQMILIILLVVKQEKELQVDFRVAWDHVKIVSSISTLVLNISTLK